MVRASVLCIAVTLGLAACQPQDAAETLTPAALPADIAITAPASEVPADVARFSGIWEGTWGRNLSGKLAVRQVGADGAASAVYAWGDHPEGRFTAGMADMRGEVRDGVLSLETFRNGAQVSYIFLDTGEIEGRYLLDGETSIGRFARTAP